MEAPSDVAALAWLEEQLRLERSAAEHRHGRILVELQARLVAGAMCADGQLGAAPEAELFDQDVQLQIRAPPPDSRVDAAGVESSEKTRLSAHKLLKGRKSKKELGRMFGSESREVEQQLNRIQMLVKGQYFEGAFAVLILINAFIMSVEVQYMSYGLAQAVGLHEDGTVRYEDFGIFMIADIIFGVLFWIELLLKLYVKRSHFLHTGWNCFDSLVMLAWTGDWMSRGSLLQVNPTILRVCRLARLLRLGRLVRHYELFDSLVLMVCSIKASLWVLIWSTAVLCGVMVVMAMVFNSMLSTYVLEGPDEDLVNRQKVFTYFGSFTRSIVTLFEVTLGNWVPVCRTLMESVTEWYGLMFILYKLLVGFGVIKVISAIFLCETMKCANSDDELMIQMRDRQKRHFMEKMAYLFETADFSDDGLVSREEFVAVLRLPRVALWLQAMELNIPDPSMVFDMLDVSGDGQLDYHELVKGMGDLKGVCTQLHLECVDKGQRRREEVLDFHSQQIALRMEELSGTVAQLEPILAQVKPLLEAAGVAEVKLSNAVMPGARAWQLPVAQAQ